MTVHLRSQDGANAVEFALVLPMLLILIFGAITAGLSLNTRQQMDHAVREGVRFGATLPYNPGTPGAIQCDTPDRTWHECVRDHVLGASVGFIDTTTGGVCVSYIEAAGTAHTQEYGLAAAGAGGDCFDDDPAPASDRVQVAARMPGALDAVFFGWSFDLDSQSVSLHEGS